MNIRVLLVDDYEIVCRWLRSLIETNSNIELVAEAENERSAVELARETDLDVVIMNIDLPDINGIEATKQIVSENPEAKVLAVSSHSDEQHVKGFFVAGGKGYVCKRDASHELAQAIQAVHANEAYLSSSVRT